MWFAKKVNIYKKKNSRETWQKIKDLLKSSGFKGVRASHYAIESLNACGCGSKLDPRNFGANGHIDRDVYFIDVNQGDESRARELITSQGIELVIESDPWGKTGRI